MVYIKNGKQIPDLDLDIGGETDTSSPATGCAYDGSKRTNRELLEQISDIIDQFAAIAKHIHYPECWDTMAYPTLYDAVREITHCDEKQCQHNS